MPNSNADNAKPASVAGEPAADAKSRARAGRHASADRSAPRNGITITRWSLGVSLSIAITILGGAFTSQSDRIGRVEDEVRDLRAELHTEINGFRGEVRADIGELRAEVGDLREEVRADIGALREEMGVLREEMGVLREEVRQLAALIRARDAPDGPGAPDVGAE